MLFFRSNHRRIARAAGFEHMPSRRIEKVNRAILETISSTILFELRDPRVKNVTVLNVEATEDLKAAKVRIGVRGDAKIQSLSLHGLESSRGFLQSKIADRLESRNTPILKFVLEPNWLDHLKATSEGFQEAEATRIELEPNELDPTELVAEGSRNQDDDGDDSDLDEPDTELDDPDFDPDEPEPEGLDSTQPKHSDPVPETVVQALVADGLKETPESLR